MVRIKHSCPPIWRRFVVANDGCLDGLYRAAQDVMGWQEVIRSCRFRGQGWELDIGGSGTEEDRLLRNRPLKEIFRRKTDRCEYGFLYQGSRWDHELIYEGEVSGAMDIPWCLDGSGACPEAEDGGIREYERLLKIYRNRNHAEHDRLVEAWGKDYDPDFFDPEEINGQFVEEHALKLWPERMVEESLQR